MLQYFLIVLALLLCECAGGVVAAVWPRCVGLQNAQGGAVGSLQAYYALPDYEHWTAAMDLAQTQVNTVETNRAGFSPFCLPKCTLPLGQESYCKY